MQLRLVLGLLLVLTSACGGDDDGGVDAATADAATADGGSDAGSDAGSTVDAGSTEDAGASEDAGLADAGLADAGEDASVQDAGSDADVDGCGYVAEDEVVVRCDGTFTFVNYFTSAVDGCAPFYAFTPDGPRFDDYASVIASTPACDAGCVYDFAVSVMRVYCGRRGGYEVLRADGCEDVYRFDDGWYESVEAYDASHPCD
ncbi:MAG: hypothetical protein H6721_07730 [Sandaracinus sp.]|nr:hypothetical protein [Sandaracinus sp.]MCB9632009.1 hypothetical protein [Sandaracinus sp.]